MGTNIDIKQSDQALVLRLSLWGRIRAGIERGVKILPWLLGIAVVFFIPDYIGQYADQEPVAGLFWGTVAALAVLGSALWGVTRVFRQDVWIVDVSERTLSAEIRTLWTMFGEPGRGVVDLRNIDAVELTTARWPKRSEVAVRLQIDEHGTKREVMFEAHGMADEIEEVARRLVDYLEQQRYFVDLEHQQ